MELDSLADEVDKILAGNDSDVLDELLKLNGSSDGAGPEEERRRFAELSVGVDPGDGNGGVRRRRESACGGDAVSGAEQSGGGVRMVFRESGEPSAGELAGGPAADVGSSGVCAAVRREIPDDDVRQPGDQPHSRQPGIRSRRKQRKQIHCIVRWNYGAFHRVGNVAFDGDFGGVRGRRRHAGDRRRGDAAQRGETAGEDSGTERSGAAAADGIQQAPCRTGSGADGSRDAGEREETAAAGGGASGAAAGDAGEIGRGDDFGESSCGSRPDGGGRGAEDSGYRVSGVQQGDAVEGTGEDVRVSGKDSRLQRGGGQSVLSVGLGTGAEHCGAGQQYDRKSCIHRK